MPTAEEITANKERLYESSSLRDDINDDEATVLLKWGETQVERLAEIFPDEFEQKCRFLRQVLKNINRFVGQRQFNEFEGQQKYMKKISMYLPQLGWESITEEQLFAVLPEDKANMSSNLQAILDLLSPKEEIFEDDDPTEPTALPSEILAKIKGTSDFESNITENEGQLLENPNEDSINQAEIENTSEIEDWHDEEE